MSDLPIEQRQADEALAGFRGRVLVGGLGLGYAAHALANMGRVSHVTVVEIAQEVVDLVGPHIRGRPVEIVRADLFDFLREYRGKPYHRAFYDVWRSDGEATFHEMVVPLHRLSRRVVEHRPVCWNEGVMRGQLRVSAASRLLLCTNPEAAERLGIRLAAPLWEEDGTDCPWHNWLVPFFRWWRAVSPTPEKAQEMVEAYCSLYGLAGWERLWKHHAAR